MILQGVDLHILDPYLSPSLSLIQVILAIYIFMYYLGVSVYSHRQFNTISYIAYALILLHPFLYGFSLPENANFWSSENYSLFLQSRMSYCLQIVQYVYIDTLIILAIWNLTMFLRKVERMVPEYASEEIDDRRARTIGLLVLPVIYMLCVVVDTLSTSLFFDYYTIPFVSLLYILFSIKLLGGKDIILQNNQTMTFARREMLKTKLPKETASENETAKLVEYAIRNWVNREDKPYSNPDLTLKDVANDTGIPMPILLSYLRRLYGRNFEEWVSELG